MNWYYLFMAGQKTVWTKRSSLGSYRETSGQPVYSFPSYSIKLDEIYWWGKHESIRSSRNNSEPGRRESNKQAKKDGNSRCLVFSVLFSPHSDHNWSSDRVCCVGEYLLYHSLYDIDKAKRIFEVSRNALTWRPIDARTRAQCLNGLQ